MEITIQLKSKQARSRSHQHSKTYVLVHAYMRSYRKVCRDTCRDKRLLLLLLLVEMNECFRLHLSVLALTLLVLQVDICACIYQQLHTLCVADGGHKVQRTASTR